MPFESVFLDGTSGNKKIQKKEYLDVGMFPVIDQGQREIAGYQNEEGALANCNLPVVLFGDHTKVFKYINYPFSIGADGVKILTPRFELDVRFFYHQLNSVKLPGDAGYSRHFKFLKRTELIVPPLEEQRRIAAILDKADAIHRKRQQAIALTETFLRSVFLDMFGDPVTNPKGWRTAAIDDVATKVTDGEHSTPERTEVGVKLLSARNVKDGYLDWNDEKVDHVPQEEYERLRKRCEPLRGDILISCSGSIGRVAIVETDDPLVMVRSAALIKPDQGKINSLFLSHFLRTDYLREVMTRRAKSSSQANLFIGPIKELPVFLPSLEIQEEFSRIANIVSRKKVHLLRAKEKDGDLFFSLSQKAFKGELTSSADLEEALSA